MPAEVCSIGIPVSSGYGSFVPFMLRG